MRPVLWSREDKEKYETKIDYYKYVKTRLREYGKGE